MDIIYTPFFSPLLLILVTGLAIGVVVYFERSIVSKYILVGLVVLVGLVAFKPSLITRTPQPPSQPIKIVYENNVKSMRAGIEDRVETLSRQLKNTVPGASVDAVPLDDRWDTSPVFRDYNRLENIISPRDPVQIIVGSGKHTRPGPPPSLRSRDRRFRAQWNVVDEDTSAPFIRAQTPVIRLDSPGRSNWELNLRFTNQLENPVLRLREGENTLVRQSVAGATNQTVSLESPPRERGFYYFVAELLEEGEESLPVGHPRRTGVGLVVSQDQQQVLISDRYPRWVSGWWGRAIKNFGQWDLDYEYRSLERPSSSGSTPADHDLVVYVGFPQTEAQLDDVRRLLSDRVRMLFVLDRPENRTVAQSTLTSLGFHSADGFTLRKGEFELELTDSTGRLFPGLARYDLLMNSAPPIETIVSALGPNDRFVPVLEADGSPLFMMDDGSGLGVLTTPVFHRWAMELGRFGQPSHGGDVAREIIGKMLRLGDRDSDRHLELSWTRAGQPVPIVSANAIDRLDVKQENGNIDRSISSVDHVTFSRPGKFVVEGVTGGDVQWEESIVVVEPDDERIFGSGSSLRGLVADDRVFSSRKELVGWVQDAWSQQTRQRNTVIIGWNHFTVLILLIGLLSGAWFVRDRGIGR